MPKKVLVLFIIIAFVVSFIPAAAHAATYLVGDGGSFDVDTMSPGDTVSVSAGAAATIYSTSGNTLTNVSISCGAGVTLTIQNVHINNGEFFQTCALSFSGGVSYLIVVGENDFKSGENEAGIRAEDGTTLNISGSGELTARGGLRGAGIGAGDSATSGMIFINGTVNAYGGYFGAGIGGGSFGDCGTVVILNGAVTAVGDYGAGIGGGFQGDGGAVTILDGTVIATGGNDGAGIGGGEYGDSGSFIIRGGTVTATGGNNGAGIGGGTAGDGGTIDISGGTVTAYGGDEGAGIGGGRYGNGGTIDISGGMVTASGGSYGAGIGGGRYGNGGTVAIYGGTVFAKSGSNAKDIGPGDTGSSGSLTIFDSAAVFLWYDDCSTPVTSTHRHIPSSIVKDGKLFGYDMPGGWSTAGAYLIIDHLLTYDADEGTGSNYDVQFSGGSVTIQDDSGFSRSTYTFSEWNTAADGSGTTYPIGQEVTMSGDITLYAEWDEIPVAGVVLDQTDIRITLSGGTLTLNATVSPNNATHPEVTWESSDLSVASVDSGGIVSPVGVGFATITATAEEQSATCDVEVWIPVTELEFKLAMYLYDKILLVSDIEPGDATYKDVTWTSSDTSILMVDGNGYVTAAGAGAATITGDTADGVARLYTITVMKTQVTSVTLSDTDVALDVGESKALYATIAPDDATYTGVSWQSSDISVAIVDSDGEVTAIAAGTANITAAADGVFDTCSVSVAHIQGKVYLSLSSNAEVLSIGDKVALNATVTPAYAANAAVEWTSTNESVAMVDDNGNVTAVSEGIAVIIARASDAYDVCGVYVRTEELIVAETFESEASQSGEAPQPETMEETVTQDGEAANGEERVVEINGEQKETPNFLWGYILIGLLGAGLLGAGVWIYMLFRKYR